MIGWDEIVDAGISPSKALVMWWRHDRKYQLLKALEQGYQVVLTPRRPLYGDFVQDASHKVGRYWDGFNPLQDIYAFPEPISHLLKDMKIRYWVCSSHFGPNGLQTETVGLHDLPTPDSTGRICVDIAQRERLESFLHAVTVFPGISEGARHLLFRCDSPTGDSRTGRSVESRCIAKWIG